MEHKLNVVLLGNGKLLVDRQGNVLMGSKKSLQLAIQEVDEDVTDFGSYRGVTLKALLASKIVEATLTYKIN